MADIANVYAQCANGNESPTILYGAYNADFPESAITGSLTIQAWVRIDYTDYDTPAGATIDTIFRKVWIQESNNYWFYITKDGRLRFSISGTGEYTDLTDITSVDVVREVGVWTHFAVTYNAPGGTAILYKNGVAIADDGAGLPNSIFPGTSPVWLGLFNGGLCYVALFDDIRTPTEILYSYEHPKENLSTEGNIIAYWHFDDLPDSTVITNGQGDSDRDLLPYVNGIGFTTYETAGRTIGGSSLPIQGFSVGVFGTTTFGLESRQITVTDAAIAAKVEAKIAFAFKENGGNMRYYDDYVIEAPNISKGGGGMLSVGTVSITVDNTDQSWNIFRTDSDNLGQPCRIGMWFDTAAGRVPGTLWLFTGIVREANFVKDTVILELQDKFAHALGTTFGDGIVPFTQAGTTEAGFSGGTILWNLLTASNWGNLDDAESIGNQDIDYSSFAEWAAKCDAKSYTFRARFTGHTLQDALSILAEITNSIFWVHNNGRIHFIMLDPADDIPVSEGFNVQNCFKIDVNISKQEVINFCVVWYGYDFLDDSGWWSGDDDRTEEERWLGSTEVGDIDRENRDGRRATVFQGKVLWHVNPTGATNFATDYLNLHKYPMDRVQLETPLWGFLTAIGGKARVNEPLKGMTAVTGAAGTDDYIIDTISNMDLGKGTANIEGRAVRFWGE